MTVYADASVIVSAFAEEIASDACRVWFASLSPGTLVASKWCETEVASALALKVRTGALAPANRAPALRAVRDMLAASATMIVVDAGHFDRATDLLDRTEMALRGGDALHLAIAGGAGATLFTLDRKMAEAGVALHLDVRLVT